MCPAVPPPATTTDNGRAESLCSHAHRRCVRSDFHPAVRSPPRAADRGAGGPHRTAGRHCCPTVLAAASGLLLDAVLRPPLGGLAVPSYPQACGAPRPRPGASHGGQCVEAAVCARSSRRSLAAARGLAHRRGARCTRRRRGGHAIRCRVGAYGSGWEPEQPREPAVLAAPAVRRPLRVRRRAAVGQQPEHDQRRQQSRCHRRTSAAAGYRSPAAARRRNRC